MLSLQEIRRECLSDPEAAAAYLGDALATGAEAEICLALRGIEDVQKCGLGLGADSPVRAAAGPAREAPAVSLVPGQRLRDPKVAAGYLNGALDAGNPGFLLLAIRRVAEAQREVYPEKVADRGVGHSHDEADLVRA